MTSNTYNVTFIASHWHITTTVQTTEREGEYVARAAAELIFAMTQFDPLDFKLVDIEVELVGEGDHD